ncbi:hypothetical protein BFJ66_g16101 [Fusarium oxysporum f. sp. cepae]|nr:hypothetical protein BFJ66_g16101 [Fusarium oxysporum f. sp. cepae]RKK48436.1 hypothetical protein BFJ67_g7358 [Fusarium oxysporum f. sp. cepae]
MAAKGDPEACFNDPNPVACVKSLEDDKISWVPDATPQTLLNLLAFEPKAFIHRIAPTPFLLLIADTDLTAITSEQLATYERAREPKRLHILSHAGHFDPYFGDHFKANMEAQLKFLKEFV